MDGIGPRLLGVALILVVLSAGISKPTRLRLAIVHLVCLGDLLFLARPLMKTVPNDLLQPSPLVVAAQKLDGRIFERAPKDLNAVVYGLNGRYPADDSMYLAVAQCRQAWALSGVAAGLRYAYDDAPDGSYTWRDEMIHDYLGRLSWEGRVRWLRAVGVKGFIAPPRLNVLGAHPIAYESVVGVPTALYEIHEPLAEVRRVSKVRWVRSAAEALHAIEQSFDPDELVVEGVPSRPSPGTTIVLRDTADEIEFVTKGLGTGIVFIARTYTTSVRAMVGSRALSVMPANVHLTAILVPPGDSTVTVRFAP
jgi:hypothetical protein